MIGRATAQHGNAQEVIKAFRTGCLRQHPLSLVVPKVFVIDGILFKENKMANPKLLQKNVKRKHKGYLGTKKNVRKGLITFYT